MDRFRKERFLLLERKKGDQNVTIHFANADGGSNVYVCFKNRPRDFHYILIYVGQRFKLKDK